MGNEGAPKFKRRKSKRVGGDIAVGGVGLVEGLYQTMGRVNESHVEFVKRIVRGGDDDEGNPSGGSSVGGDGESVAELDFDKMISIVAVGLVLFYLATRRVTGSAQSAYA
jgi:hypothetical protein